MFYYLFLFILSYYDHVIFRHGRGKLIYTRKSNHQVI